MWSGASVATTLSGVGIRAVGGFKWQTRNRFVLEFSGGLTTRLYSVERLPCTGPDGPFGDPSCGGSVKRGPTYVVPEINLRLGWRTKQ